MSTIFTCKGKVYEMMPVPKETSYSSVCPECPLRESCSNLDEAGVLARLMGGFCEVQNAHPVLIENPVQERTILLKKTGPFRNSNEENDWNEVLTIAKSWGWIQD